MRLYTENLHFLYKSSFDTTPEDRPDCPLLGIEVMSFTTCMLPMISL